jgi:arylsulfatase A-like enzyme
MCRMKICARPLLGVLLMAGLVAASLLGRQTAVYAAARPLNILFIILDDVGVDQLAAFNPAALTAALTPNLNAIIAAGIKFTSFTTMPECSPSRVAFFTGRYPLRTGVTAAILDQDLPAAQLSPFEATTPRVLATAGYQSALLGKYHLGGPENNPDGNRTPVVAGWNYFNGNMRGGPPPIDVTLGGQYTRDTEKYSCGFPVGPARGAAWFLDAASQPRCDDNNRAGYTGQQAVALGAIPALDAQGNFAPTCREAAGAGPDFTKPNGYYVWPQGIADANVVQSTRSRQYMTTAQTDAALQWIRRRAEDTDRPGPWMATVSYNAIHTPYQQPPAALYPPGFTWPAGVPENCKDGAAQRVLSDLMLAAVDQEIGRLLVGLGLAHREAGRLVYRPESSDTMVIIVGDNGSFVPSVKPPYDPIRSKFTAYQTGVLTPLIVAGPLVVSPGRTVEHIVDSVDLFALFGEIADVDVRALVPSSQALDAQSVIAYLTHPFQGPVRRHTFTQIGRGLKPATFTPWPCVIRVGPISVATDSLLSSQVLCEGAGGTWFGPTASQPNPPYPTSCDIKAAGLFADLRILPPQVRALRNDRYKLVQVERPPCERGLGEYEFYDLAARSPANPIGLDLLTANLLTNGQPIGLTTTQMANFAELSSELDRLLGSEPVCHGDGNLDKRVDWDDLVGVSRYGGLPSVFDFSENGTTGLEDLQCVLSNYGNDCRRGGPGTACR